MTCIIGVAGAARAQKQDVRVETDTIFQVYDVRTQDGGAYWTRRRLVQTVGLTHVLQLGEQRRSHSIVPVLVTSMDFRLNQEFGSTCSNPIDSCVDFTRPRDFGTHQPLLRDGRIDIPQANFELRSLPFGTRIRAGRFLSSSVVGFARIDGASVRTDPSPWFALEVFSGSQVRSTSLVGSDAFQPQGVLRLDMPATSRSQFAYIAFPKTAWIVGVAAEGGHRRWSWTRGEYRETWDADGIIAKRGALSISSEPWESLRFDVSGVWDVLDGTLINAFALATVRANHWVSTAQFQRYEPRFDAGSIWGYFPLVPVYEASAGVSWMNEPTLQVGGRFRTRWTSFQNFSRELDMGTEGNVTLKLGLWQISGTTSAWRGDLGTLGSVWLNVVRPIGYRWRFEMRGSVWYFDDPLRQGSHGTSVAEGVVAQFALSELSNVRIEIDHSYNDVSGHRVRGLAYLGVKVWR